MSLSFAKLSTKCGIFFERATPIVVQATDFKTLLMLHKSHKKLSMMRNREHAIFFEFEIDSLAFRNRKT
jgi:hypothetical protein